MSINDLFDTSDGSDPNSLLIDSLDNLRSDINVRSKYEAIALRISVDTAKWSARQNPEIAVRYCRELDWKPRDLAVMMIMQCAIAAATRGEFVARRGVLTSRGEGFRLVVNRCLRMLVESGRVTQEIAEIELRELDADIEEAEPLGTESKS